MLHAIRNWVVPLLFALTGAAAFGALTYPILWWAAGTTGSLLLVGLYDLIQPRHSILRNYPVLGHLRFIVEDVGPELHQYIVEGNTDGRPFDRDRRSLMYARAKGMLDKKPFGTELDVYGDGYIWLTHSILAKPMHEDPVAHLRIDLGGPACTRPYSASIYNISAMSFGSLGKNAISALNIGARDASCFHNTGEGGVSRHHRHGADLCWQLGTGYFGCRTPDGKFDIDRLVATVNEVEQIRMIEIKLSQGAKPGKGGILPGAKVTEEIARIRGIPAGEDSISPNRHREIDNVDDLLDFIERVRDLTGKPVGFKTVVGAYGWLEELFQKARARGEDAGPDFITVDSGDGGSGAAPKPLIDNVGLPIRESLPLVIDILNAHGMRPRIRVITSGKMINPSGVAGALCLGADFVISARGFMFALGCIQALQCNRNTCPTGVTTHDKRLQRGLVPADKAERVRRYQQQIEKEVGIIAHSCGVPEPRRLRRMHCRIVQANGKSIPLDELYPDVTAPQREVA